MPAIILEKPPTKQLSVKKNLLFRPSAAQISQTAL